MPSWLLHFLNITLDKKKQCTFSQILEVILKMNGVLTGKEETYSLWKDAIEKLL